MGEQGDKGDEELATGIEPDGVGGLVAEDFCTVVEGLDELKHGSR